MSPYDFHIYHLSLFYNIIIQTSRTQFSIYRTTGQFLYCYVNNCSQYLRSMLIKGKLYTEGFVLTEPEG